MDVRHYHQVTGGIGIDIQDYESVRSSMHDHQLVVTHLLSSHDTAENAVIDCV
jgi:hypothetical protein